MEEEKTPAGEKNMALMEKELETKQKSHIICFHSRMDRLREHHDKCLDRHNEYMKAQTEPPGSPIQEGESSSPSGPPTQQQAATFLEHSDSDCSADTFILVLSCSDDDDDDPDVPPLTRTDGVIFTEEHIEYISNVLDASEASMSCIESSGDACAPSEDLMHESSSEQPEGPQSQVEEENTCESASPDEGKRRAESGSSDDTHPGPSGSKRRWQPDRDRDYDPKKVIKPYLGRYWSVDEVQAVEKTLSPFIESGKVPRKAECVACIKASSGALRRRNWQAVKSFVNNRITAMRRQVQE
ncbi:uncharacterized protein LOC118122281 isoform X2 [Hippoglossus stenolepis]|uniref:uncharacterized protein LOC118122281 isoform X2 n=1 Tax=Hippoglossus stenolepis TaxID=195615 RepID=UPI00159CAFF1|nr:uncharacterized protein LOC118122281 isoform X2 [Hippoglossus stenolepis]